MPSLSVADPDPDVGDRIRSQIPILRYKNFNTYRYFGLVHY
jgi:hypothetical protein